MLPLRDRQQRLLPLRRARARPRRRLPLVPGPPVVRALALLKPHPAPRISSRRLSVSSERQRDKTTQQQQPPTATSEGDERTAGDGAHLGALVELLPVVEWLLVGAVVQRLVVRRENTPPVVEHQVAVDQVRHDEHDQTHSVQPLPQQRKPLNQWHLRHGVQLLKTLTKGTSLETVEIAARARRRAFVLAYPKKA